MPELLQLDIGWRQALIDLERQGQLHSWSAAQLGQALEDSDSYVLGAIDGGERLIGHAVLARLPFDAELQAITVAPEWRRRGVARALLEDLMAQACDWQSERLLLEVRAGNAGAIALYRRLGFNEDGRRRGYYSNIQSYPGAQDKADSREDAILMSRPSDL